MKFNYSLWFCEITPNLSSVVRPLWVESGRATGPGSPPKFFSIDGTSAENFHFFCHFTKPV